jgi:hypothetical protein
VLDVGEEDVPDDCDDVDVEDSIGRRDPHEVQVLGRRPDAPVELKLKNLIIIFYVITDNCITFSK